MAGEGCLQYGRESLGEVALDYGVAISVDEAGEHGFALYLRRSQQARGEQ